MSARELQADLVLLGRTPAPAPRPAFVAELEARLAEIVTSDAPDGPEGLSERTGIDILPATRGRGPGLAVAVALAVVVSTAGLAVVSSGDGRDARTATVETAFEATADGGTQPGTVEAADHVAPPGSRAASGRARGGPSATAPGDGVASTASPSAVTNTPIDLLAKPSAHDAQPAQLGLRGSGTPAYSFLEWDRYGGGDFAAYLVLRAAAPDDPTWPDQSKRTIMLMRIEDRDTTRYEAQGKVGTTPRFRIVALDRDGNVVATSGVFQADVGAGLGAPRHLEPPGSPLP